MLEGMCIHTPSNLIHPLPPLFLSPPFSPTSNIQIKPSPPPAPSSPNNLTHTPLPSIAIQTLLPNPVPVHHLGLFREPTTLAPVEYYNNLPHHVATSTPTLPSPIPEIAILIDPVIATGGTAVAAIQTLLEWGVGKVVMVSVLGSEGGVRRAAAEGGAEGGTEGGAEDGVEGGKGWRGKEKVEIWIGGLDRECDARGMIKPGVGDLGDRLFLTIGK